MNDDKNYFLEVSGNVCINSAHVKCFELCFEYMYYFKQPYLFMFVYMIMKMQFWAEPFVQ